MDMNKIILAAVAAISVAGLGAAAEATTIHMGGSSAARAFINQVPLALCAQGAATDITHFATTNNNNHLWTCTIGGDLKVMNYVARGSADGITTLTEPIGSAGAKGAVNGRPTLAFLDDINPIGVNGCPALTANVPKTVTGQSGTVFNVNISETLGCPVDAAGLPNGPVAFELNLGASDVLFSSFGQVSPGASEPVPPAGSLVTDIAMVLPFNVVLAKNLVKLSDSSPVTDMQRKDIESLFAGVTTDWRELGIGFTVNGNGTGGLDAPPYPVRLCMRSAGSGSKAAFDKIIMKEGSEVTIGNPNWVYNSSSSNMRGCLNSTTAATRGRIGYIDANEAQDSPAYFGTVVPSQVTNGYPVKIDGYIAIDSAAANRSLSLAATHCGKAEFTTNFRFYRRIAGSYDAATEGLAQQFVDAAKDPDVIRGIPLAWAYAAPADMLFTRTDDGGVQDSTFDRAGAGSTAVCNSLVH